MTNTCDGKKCDDTTIPCSFARQVVYSLQCDKKDLQEELLTARDNSFYSGVLVCLQVLHLFDAHTQAMEIVNVAGGILKMEIYAKNGSDVDTATMAWLKLNELNKKTGGGA